ncbi:hypothetical protein CHS0354_015611 [Potamilus streckersoni]|uniref:Uncharacterized protein n=1 Tax=Potamilus streckersoni TaxID=2493646 RepID=A0AAE0TBS5_9BIVA|nr:hypothetical protein CHS0354_015611 [Potamilus streckersoni]
MEGTAPKKGYTHPDTENNSYWYIPSDNTGLDLIRTGWAIQTIEQALELGSHDPILHISQITSFCKQHQDRLDALHARQMNIALPNKSQTTTNYTTSIQPQDLNPSNREETGNSSSNAMTPPTTPHTNRMHIASNLTNNHPPAIAGPSQYSTPHGIASDMEGDTSPTTTIIRVNASTIYPWITDFEETYIGPKGKYSISDKGKTKNYNGFNRQFNPTIHHTNTPPPSPISNQPEPQTIPCSKDTRRNANLKRSWKKHPNHLTLFLNSQDKKFHHLRQADIRKILQQADPSTFCLIRLKHNSYLIKCHNTKQVQKLKNINKILDVKVNILAH